MISSLVAQFFMLIIDWNSEFKAMYDSFYTDLTIIKAYSRKGKNL